MQVRLLGPVDVVVDGRPQPVAGRRRAGLLAVLALAAGEVVSADHLTEAVWGGEPPASNSLQSHISGLRAVLGQGAIVARPPGYMLELGPDGTDLQAAERLRALAEARLAAGEHHQLTGELEQMAAAEPLDEQLHGLLMLALYRAGRQADALAVYDRMR